MDWNPKPDAGDRRPSRHFRVDQPPAPPAGERMRVVLRGLRAVAVLILTAPWALVCAFYPPLGYYVSQARRAVAEAYNDGVDDIHEAIVVDGFDDIGGDER